MFKGFSLCSHVIAVAETNGDLKSFLDAVSGMCAPNLTAIANQRLSKGAGRKGGVPKRKRKSAVPIQTRSIRPCLLNTQKPTDSSNLNHESLSLQHTQACSSGSPVLKHSGSSELQSSKTADFQLIQAPRSSGFVHTPVTDSHGTQSTLAAVEMQSMSSFLSHQKTATSSAYNVCQTTPTNSVDLEIPDFNFGLDTLYPLDNFNLYSPVATTSYSPSVSLPASSVSQSTSHGQVVLGTGVSFNVCSPILQSSSMPPSLTNAGGVSRLGQNTSKSFTLKLKTKQIKVCQSCRKDYEGENDTLGLVVAHPERRLISNPITGAQFLGKESNSHYHAHLPCLRIVDSTFSGDRLVIPDDLVPKLTEYQKVYLLSTCLQVPVEKLNLM